MLIVYMHETIRISHLLAVLYQCWIDCFGYFTRQNKTVLNSNSWFDVRKRTYTQNYHLGSFMDRCFLNGSRLFNESFTAHPALKQPAGCIGCILIKLPKQYRNFHLLSFCVNRKTQKDVIELQSIEIQLTITERLGVRYMPFYSDFNHRSPCYIWRWLSYKGKK